MLAIQVPGQGKPWPGLVSACHVTPWSAVLHQVKAPTQATHVSPVATIWSPAAMKARVSAPGGTALFTQAMPSAERNAAAVGGAHTTGGVMTAGTGRGEEEAVRPADHRTVALNAAEQGGGRVVGRPRQAVR